MSEVPRTIVVMGVCGCGKSLIGALLAHRLGGIFEDADDLHPQSNKAKMSAGIPLTDEDRWPWYRILRERIIEQRATGKVQVLACSALKEAYREMLRDGDSSCDLVFVHLEGSRQIIGERINARSGHFMPPSLLDSQFAVLEEPREAIVVDVSGTPEEIVTEIINTLPGSLSPGSNSKS
ncbi:MAG: gluconokinase [Verrucomicrobia bacterium]|nr:gluconokinase [Verrucomicrobiota bacterium]